jgi:hypothetical protein
LRDVNDCNWNQLYAIYAQVNGEKEGGRKLLQYLPTSYRGIFVSLNARKVPCAANAITIGRAPKALNVRKFSAVHVLDESIQNGTDDANKIYIQSKDYTSNIQLYKGKEDTQR